MAEAWAPVGIADRLVLREHVGETVDQWRVDWFADLKLDVVRWEPVERDLLSGSVAEGCRYGKSIGLVVNGRAQARLIARSLDLDPSCAPPERDREVMDALGGRMFEDLALRLEQTLNPAGDGTPSSRIGRRQAGVRAGVGEPEGGVLLWLVLPFEVVRPVCIANLPPPRPREHALTPRLSAIRRKAVALDANLGVARLRLADLQTLACGDVLVLDQSLDVPADLTAKSGVAVARGALTAADGRVALTLSPLNS